MPRKPDLDTLLARVAEARKDPETPEALGSLREVLASRHAHAVAGAAQVAGDAHLHDLEPDLAEAFERFMQNPVKSDPSCRAKTAIVDALHFLDAERGDLYLRAARHVQLEPVYGGREDTAPSLRGAGGRALVRVNHPDALLVLAELLADPALPARIAAARAVAYHGSEAGLPLLRLKLLSGDPEIDVVSECLLASLRISAGSIDFVAGFLDGELAGAALLALGESRRPEALPVLKGFFETTVDPDLSRSALLAAAMLRCDDAVDWLLSLVAGEPGPIARDAVRAFEIYRSDERMVARVRETARERNDLELGPTVEDALG